MSPREELISKLVGAGLLKTGRLANLLGVSRRTVMNWVKRGILPAPLRLGPRMLFHCPSEVVEALGKMQGDLPNKEGVNQ